MSATSSAQRRIAHLATLTAFTAALPTGCTFTSHNSASGSLSLVRVPCPTFGESARAAWFLDRFKQLGLTRKHLP